MMPLLLALVALLSGCCLKPVHEPTVKVIDQGCEHNCKREKIR